jgi:hypothetical protein
MAKKYNEIRITNVPNDLKEQLENIAKYQGLTLSQSLKPVLREYVNTKPENVRNYKDDAE